MFTNLVLVKENKEVLDLNKELGFSKCLFLNKDFVLIEEQTKKKLLKEINEAKKKELLVMIKPNTEEMLRFVLEKTKADIIFGQELVCPRDSVHFVRGGLDQITCKIARDKKKIIAFSFNEILNSKEKGKLLARMMFNIKLCKKYNVKMFFSNFSEKSSEMRSSHDLRSVWKVLGSHENSAFKIFINSKSEKL